MKIIRKQPSAVANSLLSSPSSLTSCYLTLLIKPYYHLLSSTDLLFGTENF